MYQQTFNCANLEKLMQLSEYLPLKHRDSFTGVHSTLLISFCTSCFSHFVAGQNISFICDSFPLTSLDSLPSAMGPFFYNLARPMRNPLFDESESALT